MKTVWLVVLALVLTTCSTSPAASQANGTVEGTVSIGPLTPVQRADETPPPIPPEVYAAYLIRIYQSDGSTKVLDVKINSDGTYRAELPYGNYTIGTVRADGGHTFSKGLPQSIDIQSGQTLHLDIDIDTGIR